MRRAALAPLLFSLFVFWNAATAARGDEWTTALRRPCALAASTDGKWLYVVNRGNGTLSVINLTAQRVVAEHRVGQRLSDLLWVEDSSRLFVTDEGTHELLIVALNGTAADVKQRLPVSPYPVSLAASPNGRQLTIASLWSRRLSFVSLDAAAGQPRVVRVLDLPFAPRAQQWLPGNKSLLVADAFGGQLAVIDAQQHQLTGIRPLSAHNIRGLAVSPRGDMLLAAHQMLNDLAHSIRNDIHWGLLMSNDLRWLRIDSLLAGGEQIYRGAHMHPLGDAGRGGGDPGGLAVAADGTVAIALAGVNEVAFGKEDDFSLQRLAVGRRPTAVKFSADGRTLYVANTFDDSISVLDLSRRETIATISLGPAPDLSLAQRGELLFYDARLSHDGWMSCHSCHTDGHTNGQMNDNFSDRSFGAAKRVLSLLGVKDTLPLAWNGQVATLEQQIHNSITGTMQREAALSAPDMEALAAFVQSLEPPPPLDRLRGTADRETIERGRLVFERRDCASCHAPPTFTSPEAYDVGLRDKQGNRSFNPPSLRGISHRDRFFHDSRAETLESVFATHGHPNNSTYSLGEIADLVTFLNSL